MKEFNLLEEMLQKATSIGRRKGHKVLASKGDIYEWSSDKVRVPELDYTYMTGPPYKYRKLESDRHTQCSVLIYAGNNYLEWKTVYRNTKGAYIKVPGFEKIIYLVIEKLPQNMK